MVTPLSQLLLTATSERAGTSSLAVPDDWTQGRSVFGGLQVAFVLHAMRALVPSVPLRTLQATFFAPVAGELRAEARVVRTGKSATHVEGRLVDGASTAALVIAVFGSPRASIVSVTPEMPPATPSGEPRKFPFLPGLTPNFTQHFDVRVLRGGIPFSGDTSRQQVLDVSILDEGHATEEHFIAIADFVPPIGLSHLTTAAPGSTLTWMLELIGDPAGLPLRNYRVDAELIAARNGYTSQSSKIWSPHGRPLALSYQSMLVFG